MLFFKRKTNEIAATTRSWRKLHRSISIVLVLFFGVIAGSGLLLGWKKNIALLPETTLGTAPNQPDKWLSIAALNEIATSYVADSLQKSDEISRIDIRPEKGTVKFVFNNHFTEVQLDCASGAIRSVAQRNSDLIEKIHDGSIVDFLVNKDQSLFKLSYTSIMGLGLLALSFSGFWLWVNPKRIRRSKHNGN